MIGWIDVEADGLDEHTGHLLEVAIVVTDDDLNEVSHFDTVVRPVGVDIEAVIARCDPVVQKMHTENGLFDELRRGCGMRRYEAEEKIIQFLTTPPSEVDLGELMREQLRMWPSGGKWGKLVGEVELDYCKNCKKKYEEHVLEDYCPASSILDVVVRWSPKVVSLISQTPLAGSTIGFDRCWLRTHMPRLEALFSFRSVDVSSLTELAKRWAPAVYAARPKGTAHRALADVRESIAYLRYYRDCGFVGGGNFAVSASVK